MINSFQRLISKGMVQYVALVSGYATLEGPVPVVSRGQLQTGSGWAAMAPGPSITTRYIAPSKKRTIERTASGATLISRVVVTPLLLADSECVIPCSFRID